MCSLTSFLSNVVKKQSECLQKYTVFLLELQASQLAMLQEGAKCVPLGFSFVTVCFVVVFFRVGFSMSPDIASLQVFVFALRVRAVVHPVGAFQDQGHVRKKCGLQTLSVRCVLFVVAVIIGLVCDHLPAKGAGPIVPWALRDRVRNGERIIISSRHERYTWNESKA